MASFLLILFSKGMQNCINRIIYYNEIGLLPGRQGLSNICQFFKIRNSLYKQIKEEKRDYNDVYKNTFDKIQ